MQPPAQHPNECCLPACCCVPRPSSHHLLAPPIDPSYIFLPSSPARRSTSRSVPTMGNGCLPQAPCFLSRRRKARLVLWGGESRSAGHGKLAGQVMVEVAGTVVCSADAFYLGRPAPVLAIEDRLHGGGTYLVLPVDRLPQGYDAVTAASLAALSYDRAVLAAGAGGGSSSASSPTIAGGPRSPFEYVKGDDGRTVIKVTPEFLIASITASTSSSAAKDKDDGEACAGALCSTPELRKHYEQLVGAARGRAWSPRLDTVKEREGRRGLALAAAVSPGRLSPVAVGRLLGLVEAKGEITR